jgi:hypothetical protein
VAILFSGNIANDISVAILLLWEITTQPSAAIFYFRDIANDI